MVQERLPITELDIKLEEIKERYKTERQKNLFTMVMSLSSAVIGVYNAFQIHSNHEDTVTKLKTAKAEVVSQVDKVYHDTPSYEQVTDVKEKLDANLLQWQAYKSKDPMVEAKAQAALDEAVKGM